MAGSYISGKLCKIQALPEARMTQYERFTYSRQMGAGDLRRESSGQMPK